MLCAVYYIYVDFGLRILELDEFEKGSWGQWTNHVLSAVFMITLKILWCWIEFMQFNISFYYKIFFNVDNNL